LDEFFKCYVESQREILYGKKEDKTSEGKRSEGKILKVAG